MGMHHREEHLPDDLSSTMRFTRSRITHWLRYYLRFLIIGLPELTWYVPLVLIRTLMMMGNCTQHSFISQKHPEDPFSQHYLRQDPLQPALLQRRVPYSALHQAARTLDRASDRVRKGAARVRCARRDRGRRRRLFRNLAEHDVRPLGLFGGQIRAFGRRAGAQP